VSQGARQTPSASGPAPQRGAFVAGLASALSDWGAGEPAAVEAALAGALAPFSDAEIARAAERIATTGQDWGYHPPDAVCRAISRVAHRLVLLPGSTLLAPAALEAARGGPVCFVANHLSYIDANVIDALFVAGGYGDVADKLAVVAGPKVFALPIRRLASLCFGAIKIPQSQSRASGEAVMPRREVARLALLVLASVAARREAGDHVLIFIEGTRSRSAKMQRVLPASARYFEAPGTRIVPLGLIGTERLVPVETERVCPSQVGARVGPAVDAAELLERVGGRRPVFADALGFLIADLLPPEYRGDYATAPPELAEARAAASSVTGERR
jgi:1-acyl-sn-glycerol-3-phosphate acyltransferase